jgi:hypothetical protein
MNDPANPKERGYFIPKPGDGVAALSKHKSAQRMVA